MMKPEDLFDTQSANENESTDKRQTSPLGTAGSDSVDKVEDTLAAVQKNDSIDKPALISTEAADSAAADKNKDEDDARLIEALKADAAEATQASVPSTAKTDTVEVIEVAPSTGDKNESPDKTNLHPPTAKPDIQSEPVSSTPVTAGDDSTVEANLPTTGKLPALDIAEAKSPVAPASDATDPTVPAAPKPAGTSTHRLDGSKQDTYVISQNRTLRAMLEKRQGKEPDAAPPAAKIVTLLIRGMTERVMLANSSVILGRAELQSRGFQPDVDLSPYGAQMRGVSRVHARLFLQDKHLYIADLYSTNGTYIAGRKLEPNDPYRLHNGVEILLGSLMIEILFE
jgi:hypothetical protein